ncbi:hypothetical protein [Candidatus Venteria ishoeyi]|uniref:SMODS-associated and fused to various effectors domain-containing protein n=1 Tax=Candidatus Venteria ishoeyi TaxID=1899563 RepID=A0A1H6F599_9GAMM|nr:hypothetical protein [Candidatus Venteria ishoeyi]SEH05262.1 Uncharacterised protein [Candidatus Venteria ishoeyi]
MKMIEEILNNAIFINLLSTAIGASIAWIIQKWWQQRKRNKRLKALQQVAKGTEEIAFCVQIGGGSNALPDVIEFLQSTYPEIQQVIEYRATQEISGDTLADAETANRILEDIYEGMRHYGQNKFTRIHLFLSGMIAYAPITSSILTNWCEVVVYHKNKSTYVPLYELDKDSKNRTKRRFEPLQTWSTHKLVPDMDKSGNT